MPDDKTQDPNTPDDDATAPADPGGDPARVRSDESFLAPSDADAGGGGGGLSGSGLGAPAPPD